MNRHEYNDKKKALFEEWREKGLHGEITFNEDGIVNPDEWYRQDKRILFVLKEAYHIEENGEPYDLAEDLSDNGPWGTIWNRVAEWSYGIAKTNANKVSDYNEICNSDKKNEELNKIAVINIKKSGGKSSSNLKELSRYAEEDGELLKRQVEFIKPNIIVCGYTFSLVNQFLFNNEIDKKKDYQPNCYYKRNGITVLDYYHPAASTLPAFMSFYALCAIYQKSLEV